MEVIASHPDHSASLCTDTVYHVRTTSVQDPPEIWITYTTVLRSLTAVSSPSNLIGRFTSSLSLPRARWTLVPTFLPKPTSLLPLHLASANLWTSAALRPPFLFNPRLVFPEPREYLSPDPKARHSRS